jgi:hypothetical protein
MATIPELLDGHVTLEVECLDRLYLNGYIGKLATGPGLMMYMRGQLGKPVPSPVVLGQISEQFREAVKSLGEREEYPFINSGTKSGRTTLPMTSGASGRCETASSSSVCRPSRSRGRLLMLIREPIKRVTGSRRYRRAS